MRQNNRDNNLFWDFISNLNSVGHGGQLKVWGLQIAGDYLWFRNVY